jgi:hypothetical protein
MALQSQEFVDPKECYSFHWHEVFEPPHSSQTRACLVNNAVLLGFYSANGQFKHTAVLFVIAFVSEISSCV